MENLSAIRRNARQALSGNWGVAALVFFLYALISSVWNQAVNAVLLLCGCSFDWASALASLSLLLLLPLAYSVSVFYLRVHRGEESELSVMFIGYKDFLHVFGTEFLKGLYTVLWMLLLVVPGIVKSYSYAMTDFVMYDNPELSEDQTIVRSMKLMQGHKMQLFLLDLSFIGWFLLCVITFGIAYFWVAPYVQVSHAEFYKELLNGEAANKQQ